MHLIFKYCLGKDGDTKAYGSNSSYADSALSGYKITSIVGLNFGINEIVPLAPSVLEVQGVAAGRANGNNLTYAATIIFNNSLKVGYVGGSGSYINDSEVPEHFLEIKRGSTILTQGSSSLKIIDGTKLEVVLKSGDFANGDTIILKTTIVDTNNNPLLVEETYVFNNGAWSKTN